MAKQDFVIFYEEATATAIDGYTGVTDFTTAGIDLIDWIKGWVLYCSSTHTTGAPSVTLQVSDDNSTWFNYQDESTDIPISEYFRDNNMIHKYFRISYTANSSDGDVTFKFVKID